MTRKQELINKDDIKEFDVVINNQMKRLFSGNLEVIKIQVNIRDSTSLYSQIDLILSSTLSGRTDKFEFVKISE